MASIGKYNMTKSYMLALLLASSIILVACGGDERSDVDHLSSAKVSLTDNELKTAIIHLKNALKQNAKNGEARWMLGQVYLEIGGGGDAEKELKKAVDLGVAGEQITVDMFNALLMQRKYDEALEVVNKYTKNSGTKSESMMALKANALLEKGDIQEAKEIYLSLLGTDTKHLSKYIGLAKVAYTEGNLEKASEYLNKGKSIDKEAIELLFVEAELAMFGTKYEKAEGVYSNIVSRETARKISKNLSMALVGLVKSQIAQNKIEDVKQNVIKLEALNKDSLLLKYIKGIIAFRSGDYTTAKEHLMEVVKLNSKFSPALLLLATSNFALVNYEQTSEQLNRYLSINPGHIHASKLLATTQIRMNQPKAAVESLNSIVDSSTEDAELIALMGQAVLQSGDIVKATHYLKKAASAGDTQSKIQLASVYLTQGDIKKALEELNEDDGKKSPYRQKSLVVLAHLHEKDYSKAELKASKLIKENPKDARAYNLLGTVYLYQNKADKAKKQFDLALDKNPKFLVAWKNIASIYTNTKDYEGAVKAFNSVLDVNEKDIDALMGLASIREKQGRQEDAIALLTKAREADSKAEKPRVALGTYYMRKGMIQKALEIESELSQYPNASIKTLAFRGVILLNTRNKKSMDVYKKLTDLEPDNHFWHYRYGFALMTFDQNSQALPTIQRASSLKPSFLPASSLLVSLEAKEGNYDNAYKVIKRIRRLNHTSPAADSLTGDISMIQLDYQAAYAAYKSAFKKVRNNSLLLKYVDALDKAGKSEEANSNLVDWLTKTPKDHKVRNFYGDYLNRVGKTEQSIMEYRKVLSDNDQNIVALNDLANLLYDAGKITEGKNMAKKAYDLAPNAAEVIDTLGWILFRNGDVDKSLELIQKASEIAPSLYEIKYHLAEVLVKTNQHEQARKILVKILKVGGFDSEDIAKKLLKQIN